MSKWNRCSQNFRKHLLRKMPTSETHKSIRRSENALPQEDFNLKSQNCQISRHDSNMKSHPINNSSENTDTYVIPTEHPNHLSSKEKIEIIPEPIDSHPNSMNANDFLMVDSEYLRVVNSNQNCERSQHLNMHTLCNSEVINPSYTENHTSSTSYGDNSTNDLNIHPKF